MDDKELFKKISGGDRQAFNHLTERYYSSLCAFAFRITKSYEAAEDVVQDSFINLWVSRKNISEFAYGKTYLYSIVKNRSLSHLRAHMRRQSLHTEPDMIQEDASRYFIEQETYRMVMQAIAQLPPRTGEVIRLSLQGMRQDKIGAQMGITVATVKALKADGIKKLRNKLGDLYIVLWLFYGLFGRM